MAFLRTRPIMWPVVMDAEWARRWTTLNLDLLELFSYFVWWSCFLGFHVSDFYLRYTARQVEKAIGTIFQ